MCASAVLQMVSAMSAYGQVSSGMRAQDLGINAAIGLATATVWSIARGRGVGTSAVWRGLVGGAAIGVGRQVAASPFGGSGFVGREISAAGISTVTSAGADHLKLSFPVGPVEIQLVDGRTFDWRVNATYAVAAVLNATGKSTRLDGPLSLSSGTFVFRATRATLHTSNGEASGSEFFGGIKLSKDAFHGSDGTPNVLYHENVHVLQDDFLALAVANPIERAVLSRVEIGRRVTRHIDVGLLSLAFNGLANNIVAYPSRPWEREAYALTPRHNY
ncbi:MAG: hypothetical protein ABI026_07425 [Gemmatimonadaceae bacterium]